MTSSTDCLPKLVYNSDSTSTAPLTSTSTSVRIPSSPTGEDSPRPTSPMTSKTFEVEQAVGPSMEERFETLRNEFIAAPKNGLKDFGEWNDRIRKELGGSENEWAFYQWLRKRIQKGRPDSSLAALAKSIHGADFIQGNNAAQQLKDIIRETRCRPSEVQDLQCRYDDFRLGLRVGGRTLRPPPAADATVDAYHVVCIHPYACGIRYARDNEENQELLVYPLGCLFFKPLASNDGADWLDLGLALVVSILKDGTWGPLGNLFMVSTAGNWLNEFDDPKPTPPKLPGLPEFTVAQLNETVGLVPRSQEDVDQNIRDKLKIESKSEPIIVQVGGSPGGPEGLDMIAMFPGDEVGQDSEVTDESEGTDESEWP
ncbi:hypothetical protein GGR51DRAFT_541901 [Nemania sp. FL0031]|nr:hypothetical protein GGR51DRAFT_541901 [Nemania sp. FL0031]